jgi:four helix bundle protein
MKITRFEDLICWQEARKLTKDAFLLSNEGILAKDWDTRSQFRRATLSIMNNIAEGFGRFSRKDFAHFLNIANASACEVKSMLYVFEDIAYLDMDTLEKLHQKVDKIQALVIGLKNRLNKS